MNRTTRSYNRSADSYEKKWADYLEHTHQKLLSTLETEKEDRILDVSAGTGLFADQLIKRRVGYKEIVLNDIADEMLYVARKRFKNTDQIYFTENPVENLNFSASSFDSVVSINAFHNYVSKEKAISEIYRVLKPGGRLYILDWNRSGMFVPVNFIINIFTGEHIDTWSGKEVEKILIEKDFKAICYFKEWYYKYWKFFLLVAKK